MLDKGSDGIIIAILSAVVDKPDGMMGKEIISEVRSELPKVNASTLYPLLRQMQSDGYLEVFQKEDQGGRNRSFYKITDSGKSELEAISSEGEAAADGSDETAEETSEAAADAEEEISEAPEQAEEKAEQEIKLEPLPEPEIRIITNDEQQTENSRDNGNDEGPETVESGISDDGNVSVEINHVNSVPDDETESTDFDEPVETVWTPAANAEEDNSIPETDIPEDIQNFEFEENEENGGHPIMQMDDGPAPSDDFSNGFSLTGNISNEEEPQALDGNDSGSGLFDMDDFDVPSDEGEYGLGLDISDYNQITTMEEQLFRSQGDLDSDIPGSDSDLGEVPSVTLDDSEMVKPETEEQKEVPESHEVNPQDGTPDLPELENLLSSIKSQEETIKEENKAHTAPVQPSAPVQSSSAAAHTARSTGSTPGSQNTGSRRSSDRFKEVRNPGTEENVNSLVDMLRSDEPKKKSLFGRFGGSGNSSTAAKKGPEIDAAQQPASQSPEKDIRPVGGQTLDLNSVAASAGSTPVQSAQSSQSTPRREASQPAHRGTSSARFSEVRHPESDQTVDSLVDLLKNDEPKKKSLFGRFGGGNKKKSSRSSAPAPAAPVQQAPQRSVAKRNAAPVPQMSKNIPPAAPAPAVPEMKSEPKPAESQVFSQEPKKEAVPAEDEYVIRTDNITTAGGSDGLGSVFPVAEESRETHEANGVGAFSHQYSHGERRPARYTAASVRRAEEQDAAVDSLADLLGGASKKNTVHISGKPSTVQKFVPKSSSDAAAGKMPAKSVDEKAASGARPVETRATITKPLEAKAVATNPGQAKQAEVKETSSSSVVKSEKLAEQIKETREAKKKAEEAASIESFRERLMREHLIPDGEDGEDK